MPLGKALKPWQPARRRIPATVQGAFGGRAHGIQFAAGAIGIAPARWKIALAKIGSNMKQRAYLEGRKAEA